MAEATSATRSYAQGTPSWVDLATSDPEAARRFYAGLFGWDYQVGGPDSGGYATCTIKGRKVAGIGGEPAPDGVATAWTTYLASDDLEVTAKSVGDAGGAVVFGPADVLDLGRMLIGTDPGGALFGAWQAGAHAGAELVNEPGAVTWNELATRDQPAARDFYGDVFGVTWTALDAPGVSYYTFEAGGRTVGGSIHMDEVWPPEIPAHWMVYFAVADTHATVAKAEELGGGVNVPPTDSPQGTFAVLHDPQGATFSVIQPAQPD
jgi:predicted enzyme related to lactoylglutathione lyase